jgi:hypothetical protein
MTNRAAWFERQAHQFNAQARQAWEAGDVGMAMELELQADMDRNNAQRERDEDIDEDVDER